MTELASISAKKLAQYFESCVGKAPYPDTGSGTQSYSAIQNGSPVDCSGLFTAIFKELKGSMYHGSNTIWRQYTTDKGTVSDNTSTNGYKKIYSGDNPLKSSQLQVGMAVFKWNSSTPSKFRDGLGDYQHIGLVTSVNPLRIVHSTSENHHAGVVSQSKIGTFCAWAKLKGVDYGSDKNTESNIEIKEDKTMTGGKLKTVSNMRIRADKTVTSKVLCTVPSGKTLTFTGDYESGWVAVKYNDFSGYMCTTKSNYTTLISSNNATEEETAESAITLEERVEKMEAEIAEMREILDRLT